LLGGRGSTKNVSIKVWSGIGMLLGVGTLRGEPQDGCLVENALDELPVSRVMSGHFARSALLDPLQREARQKPLRVDPLLRRSALKDGKKCD
jgi:hypothetical protein